MAKQNKKDAEEPKKKVKKEKPFNLIKTLLRLLYWALILSGFGTVGYLIFEAVLTAQAGYK